MQDTVAAQSGLSSTLLGSTLAVTTGLSIGYIAWLVRGGVLVASFVSSLPVWRVFDPIPVLSYREDDEDDANDGESLESILEKRRKALNPGADGQGVGQTPRSRS